MGNQKEFSVFGTYRSGSFMFTGRPAWTGSGLPVAVHQGDDEDGDVVSGAQPLVGDPPASVSQHAPRSHHQVLRRHRVPTSRITVRTHFRMGEVDREEKVKAETTRRKAGILTCAGRRGRSWTGKC